MEITVKGQPSNAPAARVLEICAVAQAIGQRAGEDPADAIMMLLTAAVHLTRQYARPGIRIEMALAESLGAAIVAESDFFRLRATQAPA